ncbi:hypothetical protein KQ313_03135 [Synechococcus sp. CS-1325]|uniref:hypothetical protein n=1 Tax=Synechococcus sp. CS-1325 TaxID=2847979 RepID=UPI000DB34D10|nr:hypothetical protein [Synechococcus sp. CS-1325]MCT0198679.1 hypothetical protein [Synechococcus sp. CS-1325]PZU99574.1 MAG: hypothetical protein DCF24_08830 [Cyanobium sp.]
MTRLKILAASLLSVAAVAVASPALADTVDARCDVFPAGDDKATSSGLCTFSQRQGFVSIQLKGGQMIELKPNESTPNAFFDERGEPAKREMLEANRGQVYRLEKQSIFVFWDTAPYAKGASSGSGASMENPPEIVPLLLGIHQVKFDGACRVNFNKTGNYLSKTSACDAAKVGIAEDAIRRYFREQGSKTH